MPTKLYLSYSAVIEVSVPNAVARKLQEQEEGKKPYSFYTRHGNLYYMNDKGVECEVEIEGEPQEIDYKRTSDGMWGEEEEEKDDDCCDCDYHGDDGCKCDCHSVVEESESECEYFCEHERDNKDCSCGVAPTAQTCA
jgi:hypothetical protein